MKHSIRLIFAMLVLLTVSGCVLTARSQRQTTYYDLAIPQTNDTLKNLKIVSVNNDTPSQSRMLFRARGNRIEQDSLNCWIQPPERMLQRYLVQKFLQGNADADQLLTVRCSINAFEFDIPASEAVLSIKCTLQQNGKQKIVMLSSREKFTGTTPEELVAAMNKAVKKTAGQLAAAAKNFGK